jgi:hypothetical protein
MESPLDHYYSPILYYNYWPDDSRMEIGWVDEENLTVCLVTGTIKAADPEFFSKLKWAIKKATRFYAQILDEHKLRDTTRRPWVTAEDVLKYLGEPQLL